MKRIIFFTLILSLLTPGLLATDYKIEKQEDMEKTLRFPSTTEAKILRVDNVFGSISVEGYDKKEVKVFVHKTIKAQDAKALQKAQEEVTLDMKEEGHTIDLYVDGPFRCQRGSRNWKNPGYEICFDFTIKVPKKTALYLSTVNAGNIKVSHAEGDFEIGNVNGKIEMTEIAGAGTAHTVNGGVKVVFTHNPESDCSFKTINGDLDISFLKNLSADFQLKTFNGDMYSDFPASYLPQETATSSQKEGKFVYKSNRFAKVRIGKGGPDIKMDTLNGDILIKKK